MIRSSLAICTAVVMVAGCTMNGVNPFEAQPETPNTTAAMSVPGTCFAYVTAQENGTYTLLTGIGDGTNPAQGTPKTGLSAAAVDAAVAKEIAIMRINPECLATYVSPRETVPAAS